MPGTRKAAKASKKAAKAKTLRPKALSDRTAAQVKGGRRDRLAANHNQSIRFR